MENFPQLVRILKLSSVAVVFVFISLIPINSAHAVSFGVSPSSIDGTVLKGEVIKDIFYLSKSEPNMEMDFDIQVSGDAPITFSDEIVIPFGESVYGAQFIFDTTNLEPGDYSGTVQFIPKGQGGGASSLVVFFAVQASYHFKVLEESDFMEETLNLAPLELLYLKTGLNKYLAWEEISTQITVHNNSNAYISGVEPEVALYNEKGFLVGEGRMESLETLRPNGSGTYDIVLPGQRPGSYTARVAVHVDDRNIDQGKIEVTVVSNSLSLLTIVILIISILLTITTGTVCKIKYDQIKNEKTKLLF